MWFGKFSNAIKQFGINKSQSDHSIFFMNFSFGIVPIFIYVDDKVITWSDNILPNLALTRAVFFLWF